MITMLPSTPASRPTMSRGQIILCISYYALIFAVLMGGYEMSQLQHRDAILHWADRHYIDQATVDKPSVNQPHPELKGHPDVFRLTGTHEDHPVVYWVTYCEGMILVDQELPGHQFSTIHTHWLTQ